jgi:hypothetical protein
MFTRPAVVRGVKSGHLTSDPPAPLIFLIAKKMIYFLHGLRVCQTHIDDFIRELYSSLHLVCCFV